MTRVTGGKGAAREGKQGDGSCAVQTAVRRVTRLSVVGSFSRMARATVLALPAVALVEEGRCGSAQVHKGERQPTPRQAGSEPGVRRYRATGSDATWRRACTPPERRCGEPPRHRAAAFLFLQAESGLARRTHGRRWMEHNADQGSTAAREGLGEGRRERLSLHGGPASARTPGRFASRVASLDFGWRLLAQPAAQPSTLSALVGLVPT